MLESGKQGSLKFNTIPRYKEVKYDRLRSQARDKDERSKARRAKENSKRTTSKCGAELWK